ncbi:MAG: DUF2750 domain-containing protein [Oceanospirillaceae bacterium]|nr:DUF2750 domain-containing protein [Oceanospirillaceae bacterium]
MSQVLSNQHLTDYTAEQRFQYFIEQAVATKEVWILTDEEGCVMLNTEEEECVPVWPSFDSAQAWATGDWKHCEAEAVPLKTWQLRWSEGLEQDGFYVVVFPLEEQEGSVIHPQDLDGDFRKQIKKANKAKK